MASDYLKSHPGRKKENNSIFHFVQRTSEFIVLGRKAAKHYPFPLKKPHKFFLKKKHTRFIFMSTMFGIVFPAPGLFGVPVALCRNKSTETINYLGLEGDLVAWWLARWSLDQEVQLRAVPVHCVVFLGRTLIYSHNASLHPGV